MSFLKISIQRFYLSQRWLDASCPLLNFLNRYQRTYTPYYEIGIYPRLLLPNHFSLS